MAKREVVPEAGIQRLTQWYSRELLENITIVRGSVQGSLFGLLGQRAVTINQTVHLTGRAPDLDSHWGIALLGHECFHVVQQQEMGWWTFLVRYLVNWRPWHITDGSKHPLEKPAYERQREIWEASRS